jgi:ABC-2 type transport system permease protein
MSQFAALLRKHVIESRWLLGLLCFAFLAFGILISWQAKRYERVVESGDLQQIGRSIRPFRFFGGANMDGSTTALEVAWWNHPLVVLVVLCWAMSRGANAVAGEIERGTIDVTLSRPISRSSYLLSHIVYTLMGFVALLFFLIVGITVGNVYWSTASPPNPFILLKPGLMVFSMGLAVFGYTLPLSAMDVVRWRAVTVSAAITLLGLIGMSVAPMYENQEWLGKLSIFYFYAPVTVAMKTDPLAFNAGVLTAVFLAGAAIAFVLFSQRDLPSNS